MRSFHCADFLIYLIVIVVAFLGCTKADIEQSKFRRGSGSSGLIAFPRVGRSDPSLMNNLHEDAASFETIGYPISLEDYEGTQFNYPKTEIKRTMKAFPRVGRNSETEFRKLAHLLALQQALDKRTGPSATSGLWFGPRLGKRSINANAPKRQNEQY